MAKQESNVQKALDKAANAETIEEAQQWQGIANQQIQALKELKELSADNEGTSTSKTN